MLTSNSKNNNKMRFVPLITLLLVICTTACTTVNESVEAPTSIVKIEAEYVTMPYENMISEADAIVLGIVKHISEARWNQADGKYWEETTVEGRNEETLHTASLFHEIELTVVQTIVDDIGLSPDQIVITELGKSPIDEEMVIIEGKEYENDGYDLSVGDEIIVFLEQGEMAFRDPNKSISLVQTEDGDAYFDTGVREIVGFLVKPSESFFIKGEDGLYYNSELKDQPVTLEKFMQETATIRNVDERENVQ